MPLLYVPIVIEQHTTPSPSINTDSSDKAALGWLSQTR